MRILDVNVIIDYILILMICTINVIVEKIVIIVGIDFAHLF